MAEGDEEPPKDDVAMGSSDEDEDYNPGERKNSHIGSFGSHLSLTIGLTIGLLSARDKRRRSGRPLRPRGRRRRGGPHGRRRPPDGGPALSITKMRAVDDAFLELFGYPYEAAAPRTAGGRPGDG
ncbi:hypothetical protein THAOC_23210, partial [Thalassiosira oceanica]